MKIAFKHGDGFLMMNVNEVPDFPFIEITQELQNQFDSFINPKLKDDLSGFEENLIQVVPETISRMGLKLQLLEFGIEIEEIIETINSIPDYMFPQIEKKRAIIKFNEAAYFDRYNADLQLVATLIGLSQEDLDRMFINGKSS